MEKVEHGVTIFSAASFMFGTVKQFITGEWEGGIEELTGLATAITRLFLMEIL